MKGLKVKCLSCSGIFHETTDSFSPLQVLNGTMFVLLHEYGPAGHNWSSFPYEATIKDADLECPGCGSPYTGNIRLVMKSGNSMSVMEFRKLLEEEIRQRKEDEAKKENPKPEIEVESLNWWELQRLASEMRIYKTGMTKKELLEKINAQKT